MTVTLAVEPKHQLAQLRGKQGTQAPDQLPELHQGWRGDVAPGQVEDLVGPVIRMQPNTTPTRGHVERQLGPVIVSLLGRNDGRIGDFPLANPPERISHERAPTLELGLSVEMLELTAAAIVLGVMGTARLNPARRDLEQFTQPGPGKLLVLSEAGDLDEVSWRGPRHKDRPAIVQLP